MADCRLRERLLQTLEPTSVTVLRQFALHFLFVPPAPAPHGTLHGTAAPVRNPLPFVHKRNPFLHDGILVPVGCDRCREITILLDGF